MYPTAGPDFEPVLARFWLVRHAMAKCDYCGSTVFLRGKADGAHRFCSDQCRRLGKALALLELVPKEFVEDELCALHRGPCPRCQGPGPVDVHLCHQIWSALVFTSWSNELRICCRACARKGQLRSLIFSLLLGWWGIPWGPLFTPVQAIRNLLGMLGGPSPFRPSARLEKLVRIDVASRLTEGANKARLAA